MCVFPFQLPTLGEGHLSTPDNAVLDQSRALVRSTLKKCKREPSYDIYAVIKALVDYEASLFQGLADTQDASPMVYYTSWRLPFRSYRLVDSSPKHQVRGYQDALKFERAMVLLTHCLALFGLVNESLTRSAAASINRDMWRLATAHLLSAQSIVSHLLNNPVSLSDARLLPVDLQPRTLGALHQMCSASVHMLLVHKSVVENSQSGLALLVRAAIFANDRLAAAEQQLASWSKRDVSAHVVEWVRDAQLYCRACVYRFMALEAVSLDQVGRAVALARAAVACTRKAKRGDLKNLAVLFTALASNVHELHRVYTIQNDRLSFQPVPEHSELDQNWPSGRQVIEPKPDWTPFHREQQRAFF